MLARDPRHRATARELRVGDLARIAHARDVNGDHYIPWLATRDDQPYAGIVPLHIGEMVVLLAGPREATEEEIRFNQRHELRYRILWKVVTLSSPQTGWLLDVELQVVRA